jgi:putative ATPase
VRAGEDARFIARRMVIFASEDVGLADPQALSVATAAANAVEFVGLPECQWNLAEAVLYLATAPKSNSAMGYFEALRRLEESGVDEVPDPLKDPTRDRGMGHGQGYKYPHAFREHWVAQQYLPDALQGARFYEPGDQGFEAGLKERVERHRAMQAAGLGDERRMEEIGSGKGRRRKAQVEEHGERLVRLRDRILERAGIEPRHAVLDIGARPGLLAWGALEKAPLGKIAALAGSPAQARRIRELAEAEGVEKILCVLENDLASIPAGDASFDRILGASALQSRGDRSPALAEVARTLRPGGLLVLQEPLLAESRPLSAEVDLRPLGEDLARRIREAEEEARRDPRDPRMSLGIASLEAALGAAGFTEVAAERTVEPLVVKAGAEDLVRWLSARWGELPSYEERLLARLSPDEMAAYRRLLEGGLLGRTLHLPRASVVVAARKPG